MKESNLKTTKVIIRVITAVSFLLFTAYQAFLLVKLPLLREGRLIGIGIYVFITAASFLALVHFSRIRVLRSVLLLVGLLTLFVMRLLNAPGYVAMLTYSINVPSVLNFAVYVVSQLCTLMLVVYYLVFRTNNKMKSKLKVSRVLMTIVIVLYALNLVMECILILKYRMNIEYGRILTSLSRVLFFIGYVGTAVNFMLPPTPGESETEQYINKEQADADIMVISPENERPRSDKSRNPVLDDTHIVFSDTPNGKNRSDNEQRQKPALDDSDFVFSTPQSGRKRSDKEKRKARSLDDSDIVFSHTENRAHHKRRR